MGRISKTELIEMIKNPGDAIGFKVKPSGTGYPGYILLIIKGTWDSNESYTFFDLVEYQNEVYVAKKENCGIKPTDDNKTWITIAEFDKLVLSREEETKCK